MKSNEKMLGKLLIIAGILIFFAVVVKDVFAAGLGFVSGTEADSASASPRDIGAWSLSRITRMSGS